MSAAAGSPPPSPRRHLHQGRVQPLGMESRAPRHKPKGAHGLLVATNENDHRRRLVLFFVFSFTSISLNIVAFIFSFLHSCPLPAAPFFFFFFFSFPFSFSFLFFPFLSFFCCRRSQPVSKLVLWKRSTCLAWPRATHVLLPGRTSLPSPAVLSAVISSCTHLSFTFPGAFVFVSSFSHSFLLSFFVLLLLLPSLLLLLLLSTTSVFFRFREATAFNQQELWQYRPLITPRAVFLVGGVLSVVCLIFGIALLVAASDAHEIEYDYTYCLNSNNETCASQLASNFGPCLLLNE